MVDSRKQLLASLLLLLSFAFPLSAQNSPVDGNVPFQTDSLEYELLRNGPTQVGVSLPKYYLWVRAKDKTGNVTAEGACRVAAIEKELFEVLQFLDKESISTDPEQVETIFPALLVPVIVERSRR